VVLWGPAQPLDRNQRPPLIGNRRQGPDLLNVGNRRSATWQRLHLADPRRLVPDSRMPSYANLFTGDGARGESLVAYLGSLGADTGAERWRAIEAAPVPAAAGSPMRGARLFAAYCSACHGAHGRGDGPLAAALHEPAMDLGKGRFWLVSWGPGAESEERALARLIRFGIPGTSMPGHEWLDNREVADLAAWVEELAHGTRATTRAAESPSAAREGNG
jgi:cytochrome c oxidase cbb3-type subunit 2